MKARPIIKRNCFPIVAIFLKTISPVIVLFTANNLGMAIVHNKKDEINVLKRNVWYNLNSVERGKPLWKKLGNPESFGIKLTPDGQHWEGNFIKH